MSTELHEFPEHDVAVRGWFAIHQWPVSSIHHDFDRDIYAWRFEGATQSRTLRITKTVLTDTPSDLLAVVLDGLDVANAMDRLPRAYTVVMREGADVVLRQLERPPGETR